VRVDKTVEFRLTNRFSRNRDKQLSTVAPMATERKAVVEQHDLALRADFR